MIFWSQLDSPPNDYQRRKWMRDYCRRYARELPDGSCEGVARSNDDDEPHAICGVCSRYYLERGEL